MNESENWRDACRCCSLGLITKQVYTGHGSKPTLLFQKFPLVNMGSCMRENGKLDIKKTPSFLCLASLLAQWCALCAASMINQTSAGAEVSQRNRHSTFPMFHGRLCWWIAHYAAIPPPSFFPFSFSLSPHTHTYTQPMSLWCSGVLWVGGLVGGSWGCRAEREGIQCNMHGEITIAPLGDLQMLVVQGIVVGSYRSQYKLGNCMKDQLNFFHFDSFCRFLLEIWALWQTFQWLIS